jgi:sugar/nucleoside kinase (ribokinase family)
MATGCSAEIDVYGDTVWHVVTDGRPAGPVSVGRVEMMLGGPAAVVARMLKRLGHQPTLHTVIGSDDLGESAAKLFAAENVTLALARQSARTARVIVLLNAEGGTYQLIADTGQTDSFSPQDILLPGKGRLAYVTGFPSMYPVVDRLAAAGRRVVVDTGFIPFLSDSERFRQHLRRLGGVMDVAVLSAGGMTADRWQADAALCLDLGATAAVVTLGAHGVAVLTADGLGEFPARQVTAVDPLCAGDVFVAGYIAGRADGLDHVEAAQLGQRVAESKVAIFAGLPAGRPGAEYCCDESGCDDR